MIPHKERVIEEIREVFLNAKFESSPDSPGTDLEVAELCPGYMLVLDHGPNEMNIRLASDWTCFHTFTEIILRPDAPDWERLRRWLWDACYEEVRRILASITRSMGVSIPWPEVVERDGRKFFKGREPVEYTDSFYGGLSTGDHHAHLLTGHVGSGKTTFALRLAAEAALAGKSVAVVSSEMSTTGLVQMMGKLGFNPPNQSIQFLSPQKQNLASTLKAAERSTAQVRIIDTAFWNVSDMPKRLAMKSQAEVFITTQAKREATEQNVFDQIESRARDSMDAIYWVQSPTTLKVIKHRSHAEKRMRVGVPTPRSPPTLAPQQPVSHTAHYQHIDVTAFTQADVEDEAGDLITLGHTVHIISGEIGTLSTVFTGFMHGMKLMVGGQKSLVGVVEDPSIPTMSVRIYYA